MRTISASNPSSLKKPFCCAKGKTIQCTTCCGTPILIFSTPRTAPEKSNKIVTAATRIFFIAHLRSTGSFGTYQPLEINQVRATSLALGKPAGDPEIRSRQLEVKDFRRCRQEKGAPSAQQGRISGERPRIQ